MTEFMFVWLLVGGPGGTGALPEFSFREIFSISRRHNGGGSAGDMGCNPTRKFYELNTGLTANFAEVSTISTPPENPPAAALQTCTDNSFGSCLIHADG
jgi:hypothetical protein